METLVLIIHIVLALVLIGSILMQRSEGGLGGLGGGSGAGSFMTRRPEGSMMSKATGILAACFIATSIVLAILSGRGPASDTFVNRMLQDDSGQAEEVEEETSEGSDEPVVPLE